MDTPKNTPGEQLPSDENIAPMTPESLEKMEEMRDEETGGSRLSEFISNIPWGKILLGAFVLFFLIWGGIYLFSGNKSTSTTVVVPNIQIDEAKKTVAQEQANSVSALLGHENYNATLQPHFSLDPAQITAEEPKIALLQSAGVLEQTVKFDLWAHLTGEPNRDTALQAYETKLDQALVASANYLAQVNEKRAEVITTKTNTELRQKQLLLTINNLLLADPASPEVVTQYQSFATTADQLARLNSELSLIDQCIKQAKPLIAKAEIRQKNMQLNRNAIVQNIQVVDLDDPGLQFIVKPTTAIKN